VGGFTEQVTLIPKEDSVSGSTSNPTSIPKLKTKESYSPSAGKEAKKTGEGEKIDEKNAFEEEAGKDTLPDENSSIILSFGGEKSKTDGIYTLEGLAAGMIVILLYSRFKKPKK